MAKRKSDINMPMGKLTRIKDFLPPPEDLVASDETVKVTLLLTKTSIRFFKRSAAKHRTKYQRMIRELIDRYTQIYAN